MLFEVVLGPLWVWVRFGDVPSVWTLAGGSLLVSTLAVHEILGRNAGQANDMSNLSSEMVVVDAAENERPYHPLTSRTSFMW